MVSLFWLYSVSLSSPLNLSAGAAPLNLKAVSGYEVVKKVRSALLPFGPIQSFKMYHDSSDQSLSNLRSELGSSGVSLIDCPGNGGKEAATKKMIGVYLYIKVLPLKSNGVFRLPVDMIVHTWDHPAPRTIVVITGDRDLGYLIAILRMRKYQVILISPSGTDKCLTNQASANLDWTAENIDGRKSNMDDHRGRPPSPPPPLPQSHSSFPSPPPPPPPVTSEPFSFLHYPKTFSSKAHEIDPPMVELRGMPMSRGRQKPHSYEPDRFNTFGGSYPSPNVSTSIFGLGDGRLFAREFPITEPEDIAIARQSPLAAKVPEELHSAGTAEGFFTDMHPPSVKVDALLTSGMSTSSSSASQDTPFSVVQILPSTAPTSMEPIYVDDTTDREKDPVIIAPQEFTSALLQTPVVGETNKVSNLTPSLEKEVVIPTKDSPRRVELPIQPQAPNPFRPSPIPLLSSQKSSPPKTTPSLKAQAGPSTHKHVPPQFQVLVEVLRQYKGSCNKTTLPSLLLTRDPSVYKTAGKSKYTPFITAAIEAGLVRAQGLYIILNKEYA